MMYYIHDVDVKLAPLLERMNGFQNERITRMSCQYNGLGLASIEFTYLGFLTWIDIIRRQYIKNLDQLLMISNMDENLHIYTNVLSRIILSTENLSLFPWENGPRQAMLIFRLTGV